MRDDAGEFFCRHLAARLAVQEATGEEDAAVWGGKAVHGLDLEHADLDLGQVHRGGHAVGEAGDRGVGQGLRLRVQHLLRPPDGKAQHEDRVGDGQDEGQELDHGGDIGAAPPAFKVRVRG
jgi:hypothetical protein